MTKERPVARRTVMLSLVLMAALGNVGFAQESDSQPTEESESVISNQENDDVKDDAKLKTVESDLIAPTSGSATESSGGGTRHTEVVLEENRLLKEFQDSLLSTVHWSLTVVVTMLIILAGINWFANFKFYERDKKQLRDDLEGYVEAEINRAALEAKSLKLSALEEVDHRLESRLSDFSLRFVTIDAHRDDVDNLKGQLKSTHARISDDEFDALLTEMYMWKTRKVYRNVIMVQIRALGLASTMDDEWKSTFMLKLINETLGEFFIKEVLELGEGQSQYILDALEMSKDDDQSMVAAIKAQIEIISERDSSK